MSTIATLVVKLIGDITGYTKSMTEAERQAQQTANTIGKNLKNIGGSISGLGRTATAGLTLPLVALGAKAVDAASDLDETKNKVSVVFGSMAADVLAWSETSAEALGQSQEQALAAAGTYGNLFVSLGLAQQPAAEMSTSLVQLASDLASFNNANPEDVLQALRSGLSGEVEPLKKFGIAMNEATLKAKAMELGMGDNLQELTEAQKLQLRYALILDQTTTAQGDFARTADGLANSTRIAKAQLTDAAAALGTQLLPYALQAVRFISDLVGKFQALTPEQQKWILIIGGVVAVAGPLLVIIGSLVTAIGAIIPVVTAVAGALSGVALPILAVIAVLALLYLAWQNNWGGIQEKTAAVIAFVKGLIASGMQFIQDLTSGKLGALSQLWNNTVNSVMTIVNTWIANIKLIFQAFQAAFNGDWYRFGELLRQAWDNSWKAIGTVLQNAWANFKIILSTLVTNVVNFFRTTDWGQVGRNIVQGIANGIRNSISWIIDAARSVARAALQAAKGFLGIKSPSKVFEMQVGWQMAKGTAEGWKQGLSNLLQPSFGLLTPATAAVTPNVSVPNVGMGGGVGGGFGNDAVIELLREIANKDGIDYDKLARKLQNAVTVRKQ